MAYRRSLATRVHLLSQRFRPSFSYIGHDDDGKHQHPVAGTYEPATNNYLKRGYHSRNFNNGSTGFGALFQERRSLSLFVSSTIDSSFQRYSSSTIGQGSEKIEYLNNIGGVAMSDGASAIGEGSANIEYVKDVAEVLSDKSVEIATSHSPVVNEVAIAAADSFFPVAGLQYLIDGFHNLLPLGPPLPAEPNWWLAIVLSTILIRSATVPLLINQLKATSKLTLMRPRLEEIKEQMQNTSMDPQSVAEGQKRMQALFKEYGVTPLTPLKGLFIQGPIFISFYLAITNMVEKVPSFKEGGAFWFTDLTTPDSLYIFPVLTALSFLITVECNMQEGLEGNPIAKTMKNISRGFAVLTVPITMSFPKAIFCYWITSNLFSLTYGLVIKRPAVKKFFNIPIIDVPPPTSEPQPAFSLFSPFKSASNEASSSSVLSEKIRTLEEQVKAKDSKTKNEENK